MLPGVVTHNKAVMCTREEICVLDKALSGRSYSAVGVSCINQHYILKKLSEQKKA